MTNHCLVKVKKPEPQVVSAGPTPDVSFEAAAIPVSCSPAVLTATESPHSPVPVTAMTLTRKKGPENVCADCSAAGPGFASMNRCLLLCHECAMVHRILGRHVSDVKALSDPDWAEGRLEMIYELSACSSNGIWEHALLDARKSSGRPSKPKPHDSSRCREEFIRAKYENLAFVNKPADDSQDELSQQLHASCRTSNLKVSLRLLAAGADPNFVHPEKADTTPLHVAANSGQLQQMHLLLIWGADPLIPDARGNRPIDLAESQSQPQMITLLREAPFNVTDRISRFLCGRKGNHENGQHVALPDAPLDVSSSINLMHSLDDKVFAELARDAYDEVDRREKNQSMSSAATMSVVPFLPVNPSFSSIRNQARQKLATLIRHEFNNLLLDILTDFNRRLCSRNSDMTL